MTEHIVAIFETEIAADMAARDLTETGVPQSAIRRYRPENVTGGDITHSSAASSTSMSSGSTSSSGGFWSWLLGEEDGIAAQEARYPNDHDVYERGARAGNAVVSVTLEDSSLAERAAMILENHHPLQLDQDDDRDSGHSAAATTAMAGGRMGSEASYASGPGYQDQSGTGMGGAAMGTPQSTAGTARSAAGTAQSTMGTTQSAGRSGTGAEEVIPLKEEDVQIGKRVVDHGTTRVRRYVVDRPVEKDVTLHGERVTIERRRPVGNTDGGAFEERTVEVHETEEVPEVEKTARVVEEVAIRREATERKETVRDTVRREEVEVTGADAGRVDRNPRTR